jgi:hypothetical protein
MKVSTQLYGTLAFLPYQAQTPVTESLEWLTDVLTSQSGVEDRFQLRTNPRQGFQFNIPIQSWNAAKSFNTGYGALRKLWAIPVWTEAQYVGTVAAGATSVACNVTNYDLRANSLALLYRDENNWQLIQVNTLGGSSINLLSSASALSGAWLLPVRVGYISDNIDGRTNGHTSNIALSFDVEDTTALTPATPTQYLGKDVYYTATLLDGGNTNRQLKQQQDSLDLELGKIFRRTPWTNARYGSDYRTVTTTAAEMRAYKLFLARRAGRLRDFWLPTFEQHLRPVNVGNIASSLTIEADGFNDYTFRPHVAFQDTAGNWYPRAVSNPTTVIGNRLQLTLDSALNIDASLIAQVCYLGLNRLDADRVEINWIGNNVAESNVRILEFAP